MIRSILLLAAVLLAVGVKAQDTLFLDNDRYVTGYIYKRIPSGFLYYEIHGSDTGRRWIRRGRVLQISYQDGTYEHKLKPVKMEWLRRISKPGTPPKLVGYPNAITLNFPTYNNLGGYSGISVGAEYTRFIDTGGRFSASLAFHRLWAGTLTEGRFNTDESRTSIQSSLFVPGALYHPFGNKKYIDIGIGAAIPIGTFNREDVIFRGSHFEYKPRRYYLLAAFLLQANVTLHTQGHFMLSIYASFGPMLSGGDTKGGFGQAGLKIGTRF
jgi:hypothetical protein